MYQIQVKVETESGKKEWKSVSPSHGQAYEYKTEREAWNVLNMCYPDVVHEDLRVLQVS